MLLLQKGGTVLFKKQHNTWTLLTPGQWGRAIKRQRQALYIKDNGVRKGKPLAMFEAGPRARTRDYREEHQP